MGLHGDDLSILHDGLTPLELLKGDIDPGLAQRPPPAGLGRASPDQADVRCPAAQRDAQCRQVELRIVGKHDHEVLRSQLLCPERVLWPGRGQFIRGREALSSGEGASRIDDLHAESHPLGEIRQRRRRMHRADNDQRRQRCKDLQKDLALGQCAQLGSWPREERG